MLTIHVATMTTLSQTFELKMLQEKENFEQKWKQQQELFEEQLRRFGEDL